VLLHGHENDPPQRVIGWALASILFPRCLSWFFQVGRAAVVQLAFGAYGRCGRAATTGRGAAASGVSATAGAAATVAIVTLIVVALVVAVMIAIMVTILVVVLVLVAMVAPAKPGPRMTFVLAGKR
jgi:hypothetical protein